jgi:hypothetical protein
MSARQKAIIASAGGVGGGDDPPYSAQAGGVADTDGMGVAEEEDVDFSGAQAWPSSESGRTRTRTSAPIGAKPPASAARRQRAFPGAIEANMTPLEEPGLGLLR